MRMNYVDGGYSEARRVIANVDKLSVGSDPRRVHSKWGTISICTPRYCRRGFVRQFAVSGSKVLHNGGGYTIGGLRKRLMEM